VIVISFCSLRGRCPENQFPNGDRLHQREKIIGYMLQDKIWSVVDVNPGRIKSKLLQLMELYDHTLPYLLPLSFHLGLVL